MKEQVISLYINDALSYKKIAKKLKLDITSVLNILKEEHYIVKDTTREKAISFKQAIDYYIANPKDSLRVVGKLFGVNPDNLSKKLKEFNITIEDRGHLSRFNEFVFDSIDTEDKAYWLGFIYADGCIDSRHKKYVFELCVKESDIEHIRNFNTFMQHEKENIKYGSYIRDGKEYRRCRWVVSNKHLWETLNNYGCTPNKSLTLKFPDRSIFKNDSLIRHFIRGYFDGDGSLGCYGKRLQPNCSVVGTLDMLQNIANEIDNECSLYHHKSHSDETFTLQAHSQKAINFINYLYKDSSIYLKRKYDKNLYMCRLWEESHGLQQTKIGEGCDANPEVTTKTKKFVAP